MSSAAVEPQDSDIAPRADATFVALVRTLGLLKRVMEPHFGRFGISGSQWAVLRALHRAEEAGEASLRLSELGDRVLVRPPSVTGVVDRLHRLALVRRQTARDDARAKLVSLTPAGRSLVQRVMGAMPEQVESILGNLSRTDRNELRRLLEVVSTRLEDLAGGGAGTGSSGDAGDAGSAGSAGANATDVGGNETDVSAGGTGDGTGTVSVGGARGTETGAGAGAGETIEEAQSS